MKRRSLFKLFAAATAAVAMEVMGVSPMTKVVASAPTKLVKTVIVNPDWVSAPYEDVIFFSERQVKRFTREPGEGPINIGMPIAQIKDIRPNRYTKDDAGTWHYVPYYKEVEIEVPA